MTELDWLPSALRERIARVAALSSHEPCAAGLSGAPPPPPLIALPPDGPAAGGSRSRRSSKSCSSSSRRSSSSSRKRRRIVRSANDVARRRALVRRWAELGRRQGDALDKEDERLIRVLPWEARGWALAIVQDISSERRRAVEACLYRLPARQGRALLEARAEWGERWPLLVACALAMWRTSRKARRGARAWRLVDGISRGAYRALVLRPDGRKYHRDSLWATEGPFLALVRMGIYQRHQPPSNVARWVGPARCSACRAPAAAACGCSAPRMRWAVAQTRYQREMCGKSIASLARHCRRARAELARYAPWLVRRAELEAAERAAAELEEREPPPAARELEAEPAAPAAAAEPVAGGTGPPG